MKKIISLLLCFAIFCSFSMSSFADYQIAGDPVSEEFVGNDSEISPLYLDPSKTHYVTGYGVRVRNCPGTGCTILCQVNKGDSVRITYNSAYDAYFYDNGGKTWAYVTITSGTNSGTIGWMVIDYLSVLPPS